jgi:hypothetical protein
MELGCSFVSSKCTYNFHLQDLHFSKPRILQRLAPFPSVCALDGNLLQVQETCISL